MARVLNSSHVFLSKPSSLPPFASSFKNSRVHDRILTRANEEFVFVPVPDLL